MKQLKDYIYERQEINEAGLRDTLFGEIVMKILGTGLDWIGKAGAWLADSVKGAVHEGWSSFKSVSNEAWLRYCRETGYNGRMPKNEKEFATMMTKMANSDETLANKIKFYENMISITNDVDLAITYICTACLYESSKDDATVEDIEECIDVVKKLHKKYGNKAKKETAKVFTNTLKKLNELLKKAKENKNDDNE